MMMKNILIKQKQEKKTVSTAAVKTNSVILYQDIDEKFFEFFFCFVQLRRRQTDTHNEHLIALICIFPLILWF